MFPKDEPCGLLNSCCEGLSCTGANNGKCIEVVKKSPAILEFDSVEV